MTEVRLESLSKTFPSSTDRAVDDLTLHVRNGEFVALLGPSGCGKTTTLRMIAGLESPTGGRVLLGDTDVTNVPVQDRKLSMVFQSYAIFPHMSVAKNIGYGLRVSGVAKEQIARRVGEVAELVGIADYLDRLPRQLSGGQRQRVALARALARESRLVLFDEPLSNLDAKLRDQTRAELKRIHQTLGNTMVYVTHDQLEAMTLADRIAIMKQGVLQQYGTPQDVYARPANIFVAEFIGSPSMNLLRGTIGSSASEGVSITLDGGAAIGIALDAASGSLPDGDVVFGIRPDHLRLERAEQDSGWAVDLVEPIGSQAIIHLQCGVHRARAIVPFPQGIIDAPRVRLIAAQSEVLFFDPVSGDRLTQTDI